MQREAVLACWAKTRRSTPGFRPLVSHMLDSAAVCDALGTSALQLSSLAQPYCSYIVALHDISKADPRFQNKDVNQAGLLKHLGLSLANPTVLRRTKSHVGECVGSTQARSPRAIVRRP